MMKHYQLGLVQIKKKTAYFGEDVKKSRMILQVLEKKDQVVDLIAYLKTLK